MKVVKHSVLALVFLLFIGGAVANLSYNTPGEDNNQFNLGYNSSNVFITQLEVDFGGSEVFYITPEDIEGYDAETFVDPSSSPSITARYLAEDSQGNQFTEEKSLRHSENMDAWYLEIKPSTYNLTNLTIYPDINVNGRATDTQNYYGPSENHTIDNINVSEIQVSLRENAALDGEFDFFEPMKPGLELDRFEASVYNTSSDQYLEESDTTVEVFFSKVSDIYQRQDLGEYNESGDYHLTSLAQIPDSDEDSFVMRLTALNGNDIITSQGFVVDTAAELEGNIVELSSIGCDDDRLSQACEPEAEVDAYFDITSSDAEQVNMSLEAYNSNSSQFESITGNISASEVTANDGAEETYMASFSIPDLDRSDYNISKGINVRADAVNNLRGTEDVHNIDYETFEVVDDTPSNIAAGRSYSFQILGRKPFSNEPYNQSRFTGISVRLNSEQTTYSSLYNSEDLEFDESSSTYTADFVVPESEETGPYTIESSMTDKFGETKSNQKSIVVRDVNDTFNATDELDLRYDRLGNFVETFDLVNLLSESRSITPTTDLDVLSLPSSYSLSSDELKEVEVGVNINELGDREGQITLEDQSGHQEMVDVNIDTVECEHRSGDLCSNTESISKSYEIGEEASITWNLTNLDSSEVDVDQSIDGNISDIASVQADQILDPGTNSRTIQINASEEGSFEGDLLAETDSDEISIPMDINVLNNSVVTGLEVEPSLVELEMPEGQSEEISLVLNNTGEASIENITVAAQNHDISVTDSSLEEGSSLDLEYTVSESDTFTFEGVSDGETVSAEAEISVDILDNYSDRASSLSDRISNLRAQNTDSSLEGDLTDATIRTENIQNQWESGDYEEARQNFNEVESTVNSLESQIQNQGSDSDGGDNPEGEENESDIPPIVPAIIVLVVMLLVGGFIFFESYIPEEGDPLYGVFN